MTVPYVDIYSRKLLKLDQRFSALLFTVQLLVKES